MKNTLRFLKRITPMLALAAIMMAPMWGWGQTTYTFSSKSWAASPADWTSKKDGNQFTAGQGIQITTGATGACGNSPISFANVTSVKVGYCTNASSGAGTINVFSVADENAAAQSGTRIGTSTSVTTSGGTTVRYLTFNTTAVTGNIQIYVTCTNNSIYINSVEITYAAGPTITVNPATLTGFTYVEGSGPSAEQTFAVSGSDLEADISIAASTNYEISKTSGGSGWTSPITFTPAEVATPQTVYVRLKAGLSVGLYNSEVITASSTGATDKTVTVSGSVTAPPTPEPTNHVTDFMADFAIPAYSAIDVVWTDATGGTVPDGYVIKASDVSYAAIDAPVDGIPETPGTLIKVLAAPTEEANFTGLDENTTYYFKIWPFTNSGAAIN